MRLCVSVRFASEGLVPGTAVSLISSVSWSVNVGERSVAGDPRVCPFINSCMYDAAKQKVIDLTHNARTSFYSTMVSSSATCKELFHNMTTLWGKKPSLLSVYDSNNFHAFSVTFSKTRSFPFGTAFRVWHRRKTTVSSHFLVPHFSHLHRFLNNLLERLSFRLSPRLLCLFRYQLFYKTLEVLLTISNIFNESLTSGTVPSEFIQNSRRKTLVKETITWSKWT